MPNQPIINATVKITAKDINGNNVAKQFNQVRGVVLDYNDGTINILDATGSFYFPIIGVTTFTYTAIPGAAGSHTVVIS